MAGSVLQQKKVIPHYKRLPGSEWIEKNRAALPENQWVAADASGRLGANVSIDALMDELKLKQVDLEKVAIAFITSESA